MVIDRNDKHLPVGEVKQDSNWLCQWNGSSRHEGSTCFTSFVSSIYSQLRHFRHAWTCSQCHQCWCRQPKKVTTFCFILTHFKSYISYWPISSSGPGGSGGAVRQRKGATGGLLLFSFEFYLLNLPPVLSSQQQKYNCSSELSSGTVIFEV